MILFLTAGDQSPISVRSCRRCLFTTTNSPLREDRYIYIERESERRRPSFIEDGGEARIFEDGGRRRALPEDPAAVDVGGVGLEALVVAEDLAGGGGGHGGHQEGVPHAVLGDHLPQRCPVPAIGRGHLPHVRLQNSLQEEPPHFILFFVD